MAVQVGEKALGTISDSVFIKPNQPVLKKRKILDENTYSQDLENIIRRDFYPDLNKLKAQTEFLSAVEKNDVLKLRELRMKYGSARLQISTSPSHLCTT